MRYPIYIFLTLFVMGCTHVPSGVIGTSDMANVLADMYMAESYVDQNHHEFMTDSSKRLLKQSVLAKYGYLSADFDSSLMWYGKHSDVYLKVNDEVLEILNRRNREVGSAMLQTDASFFGDSVDVWSGAKYAVINNRFPSKFISFEIGADDNQESGDSYTWRVKIDDNKVSSIRWTMFAQYSDSTSEFLTSTSSSMGWNEVRFVTDSTKNIKTIKGIFEPLTENLGATDLEEKTDRPIWLDSISLIRKRVNPETYSMDRSRLNALKPLSRKKVQADSLTNSQL